VYQDDKINGHLQETCGDYLCNFYHAMKQLDSTKLCMVVENIGESILPNILVEKNLADANSDPLFLMHPLS